jgi:hypothetical protein
MRKGITDKRYDSGDGDLSAKTARRTIHLQEERDRHDSADRSTDRRNYDVVITEGNQQVSARHHKEAGKPCTGELLHGGSGKTARPQIA